MNRPLSAAVLVFLLPVCGLADPLPVPARTRVAAESGTEIRIEPQQWEPSATALIVCDFWDSHHCANAVRRVNELAPRMAEVVSNARSRGVLIIHAPSDCMDTYRDHPARKRAMEAPAAANFPRGIGDWLHWKNDEERSAGYPIDASDGGSDDTPEEDKAWKEELKRQGRDPGRPWKEQHPSVGINSDRDIISDRGAEIWNVLEARGIRQVLFAGVHANMCVCGRPFGLRQLSRNGRSVALLRDLTDTMYNPAKPPFVSHWRGTELMIAHIERRICPTVLSSEVFGGTPARFSGDSRPLLAVMIGEDEYLTSQTLPDFLEAGAGRDFRLAWLIPAKEKPADFFGTGALSDASVLMVSVRRRPLPVEQMKAVRAFVARGGAVAGIRTASHAFALRSGQTVAAGHEAWPEWDREVLGGNYHDHLAASLKTFVRTSPDVTHPILSGIPAAEWPSGGSLYLNAPLRGGSPVLLTGRAEGADNIEPVAWTSRSPGGGRVFYTSLGAPGDFQRPEFRQMLLNGLHWAAGREIPPGGVALPKP